MTKIIFNQNMKIYKLGAVILLTLSVNSIVFANTAKFDNSEWRPVASDKLIQLPANIIEKRIQKDFLASPLAIHMADLESQMQDKIADIKSMQNTMSTQANEVTDEQQYQVLQNKSVYLDLLQENHGLRQVALGKKQQLYKSVLDKLRHKNGKMLESDTYQIQKAQSAARERMEKVISQVDLTLLHTGIDKPSVYADEYSKNLSEIEKLKVAISRHKANASLQLNGLDISSQEYIRQLLMDVSSEQSLLDQEALMLSYMAKLVALDAQSLEYKVAYGDEDDGQLANKASKPANITNLFYQE